MNVGVLFVIVLNSFNPIEKLFATLENEEKKTLSIHLEYIVIRTKMWLS